MHLKIVHRFRTMKVSLSIAASVLILLTAASAFGSAYGDFTGKWKTNYGRMTLRQTADGTVTGQYDNSGVIGDVKGAVKGNVLKGYWEDRSGSGSIKFTLSADGNSFSGNWGRSSGNGEAGGEWNGQKIR